MKAIAFVDYENIWKGIHEYGLEISPEEFLRLMENYAKKIKVDLRAIYLYANFDKEEFWRTQTAFEKNNIFTRHVYGKNNYVNTDLRQNAADTELMLEVQEILLTRGTAVDIFLLFTGDGDFLPIIRRIRAWGKEIKIIGIKNKTSRLLSPYCESFDVFYELFINSSAKYSPTNDFEQGIEHIADLQMKLPYVASTKARSYLSERLDRTMSEIKELINYLFAENYLLEKEINDPNLVIKKTKIYLLNLSNHVVQEILGDVVEKLAVRYEKIDSDLVKENNAERD